MNKKLIKYLQTICDVFSWPLELNVQQNVVHSNRMRSPRSTTPKHSAYISGTAEGIENASEADVQSGSPGIQHSLSNHAAKGVERVGEGRPGRWKMKEAAN
jgi:hypothetical protein